VTCTATDSAGKPASGSFTITVVDTTPPVVTGAVSPAPNALGWHNEPVQVLWTVEDVAGIQTEIGCDQVDLTLDTRGTILLCTATDRGGNTASASVTVRIDSTPPSIFFDRPLPAAAANGWHQSDVSILYMALDDGSGLEGENPLFRHLTFATDGVGLTQDVIVVDLAGNEATATSPAVNIDTTPPELSANASAVIVNEGQAAHNTGAFADLTPIAITASVGTITKTGETEGTWTWSLGATDGPAQSQEVTITASDGLHTATTTFLLTVNNVAPAVSAAAPLVTVDEGGIATNAGTFGDPGDDTVTVTASSGAVTQTGSNSGTWSWNAAVADGPSQADVTITAADGEGGVHSMTFTVAVNNVSPMASAGADQDVVARQPFTLDGSWTDMAAALDAPYTWTWTPLATAVDASGQPLEPLSGSSDYGTRSASRSPTRTAASTAATSR
jgi:hypothetical protein